MLGDASIIEVLIEQRLEGTRHPTPYRGGEAHLRPLDQRSRNMPVQHLSQQVLRTQWAAPQAVGQRQRHGDHPVIQKWLAGLDACRHRRPIDLGENVCGCVVLQLPESHLFFGIARIAVGVAPHSGFLPEEAMQIGIVPVGRRLRVLEHPTGCRERTDLPQVAQVLSQSSAKAAAGIGAGRSIGRDPLDTIPW